MNSRFLVVIPTYNEKQNIAQMIEVIINLYSKSFILIVDDNSPDGTQEIVTQKMQRYRERVFLLQRKEKQGLATAYLEGFSWALNHQQAYQYDTVVQMDCDFSHRPEDIKELLRPLEQHDIAIGSRYLSNSKIQNWPRYRLILSKMASKLIQTLFAFPICDPTSGFKAFKIDSLQRILEKPFLAKGYIFQFEQLFYLKNKAQFIEVPIIFSERSKGASKMNFKIITEALIVLFLLRVKA